MTLVHVAVVKNIKIVAESKSGGNPVFFAFYCLEFRGVRIFVPMARDKKLLQRRNEKLLRRYHYWTEVERLRFDDALRILSEDEFFISEALIMRIIRENCDKLDDIVVEPVPIRRTPRLTRKQAEKLCNNQ